MHCIKIELSCAKNIFFHRHLWFRSKQIFPRKIGFPKRLFSSNWWFGGLGGVDLHPLSKVCQCNTNMIWNVLELFCSFPSGGYLHREMSFFFVLYQIVYAPRAGHFGWWLLHVELALLQNKRTFFPWQKTFINNNRQAIRKIYFGNILTKALRIFRDGPM